jgi:uncharacterized protein
LIKINKLLIELITIYIMETTKLQIYNLNEATQGQLQDVKEFARNYMRMNQPNLEYHNFTHVLDMTDVAMRYSDMEGIDNPEKSLIQTACYLHDAIFEVGAKDNEYLTAEMSRGVLDSKGYNADQTNFIYDLILATKVPTSPQNIYQEIITDADVDNLGRGDFWYLGEKLRQECGIDSINDWYKGSLAFLESHTYRTQSARSLRQKGLEENIAELKNRIVA